MNIVEIFRQGGPAMWPLLGLSILSLTVILERLWFWARILSKEKEIVNRVLDAALQDWDAATEIARRSTNKPIGRFLYAPLRLNQPDPEVFKLALESAADEELSAMRGGDKILEAIIGLAPLLGLFGTVWGLIISLRSIRISDLGTPSTSGVTVGIGEALISTAAGLVVAITTMAFYRLFQVFLFNQGKIFRKSGNELELIYRQFWSHSDRDASTTTTRSRSLPQPPETETETKTERESEPKTKKRGLFRSLRNQVEDDKDSAIKDRDLSVAPDNKVEEDSYSTTRNSDLSQPNVDDDRHSVTKKGDFSESVETKLDRDAYSANKNKDFSERSETKVDEERHSTSKNNASTESQEPNIEEFKRDIN